MNNLFDYGIHNENSDLRAHVSVVNKVVYVFPTKEGNAAIEAHPEINPVPAFQDGIEGATAMGYKMPWHYIKRIKAVFVPDDIFDWKTAFYSEKKMTTSEKGQAAVQCVLTVMRHSRFPLPINSQECQSQELQIQGTDIYIRGRWKVQVKCDWRCGHAKNKYGKWNGTGNLYLQIAERNPLKRI